MSALAWFIIVFVLAILVPPVFSFIRDWDFKRQVKGKKPCRRLKSDRFIPKETTPNDPYYEILAGQAKLKSHQTFVSFLGFK